MIRLLVLLFLLLFVTSVAAGDYYVFRDGYWWCHGVPHTRTRHWFPGTGCSPGYWYYQYHPVRHVSVHNITYRDPDWRVKLLELKKDQQEQAAFLQAIREFGLTSPSPLPVAFALSGTLSYGTSGATLYSYGGTYNGYAAPVSTLDLNLLYQQASQLVAGAQRLAGEGNKGFQELIGQEGAQRARIEEIRARGQAAQQIIAALALPPTAEMKSFSFKVAPSGGLVPDNTHVPADARAALLEQWKALAVAKCRKCHSHEKASGGFNVELYPDMTVEQKQRVIQTLTTLDENKRMPRNETGGAAPPLTPEELRLFLLN